MSWRTEFWLSTQSFPAERITELYSEGGVKEKSVFQIDLIQMNVRALVKDLASQDQSQTLEIRPRNR